MNKLKMMSVLAFIGFAAVSCNSSEKDEYRPDPNKGDYVKVFSMTVSKDPLNSDLLDVRYNIVYNNILKASSIKAYHNINGSTSLPEKAPLMYVFGYKKDEGLNFISIKKDEDKEIDKLDAKYKNDVLEKLENESKSNSTTFEYSSGNIIKATKDNKSYAYNYDNRGNLTSVSDESGKLFSYEYNNGNNPFVHSEFNLTFDYIPGGDLIRFVQGTKNAMTSAINEKTGEKYSFTYQLDEFNYPTEMVVKGKESMITFKFVNRIIRRPDSK